MSSEAFEPPDEIDDYKLIRPLGKGGMGSVYLAHDIWLDRPVAIKFIESELPTAQARQRFRVEAMALARLKHPNVMAVYRAAQVAGRPYIVGELVAGQSLDKLEKPIHWRRALNIAIGLARGLAAVHECEVLHRDIKPSNAILTTDDQVKLVDFGIAKLLGDSGPVRDDPPQTSAAVSDDASRPARKIHAPADTRSMGQTAPSPAHLGSQPHLPNLTQPGAQLGTPLYMSPEVWKGEPATASSDVYSLGVVLYELCSGRHPYEADSALALGFQVVHRDSKPLAQVAPSADRRLVAVIERCLRRDPKDRFPSAIELHTDLEAVAERLNRGRRFVRNAMIGVFLIVALSLAGNAALSWVHNRREVAVHLDRAKRALADAEKLDDGVKVLRQQAFMAFDNRRCEVGEKLWGQAQMFAKQCDVGYRQATQELDTALAIDPRRTDVRQQLAKALLEKAVLLDRDHNDSQRDEVAARLKSDSAMAEYARRWNEPGQLSLTTTPGNASVELVRYIPGDKGRLSASESVSIGTTPLTRKPLDPGSYLLVLNMPGRVSVKLPILIQRSKSVDLQAYLPSPSEIPAGFVYIPAGMALFGTVSQERVRTMIFDHVPSHEIHTDAYLIAQHETTFEEWLRFLESQSLAERKLHQPRSPEGTSQGGRFELKQTEDGSWQITLGPTGKQTHTARLGEPIAYTGRTHRNSVDWRRLPVVGIDYFDALAYTTWLGESGHVPGARLCTEREWERAARGADAREYPHGDWLEPDDANTDITYDRHEQGMGPDEVGSHPVSLSPFGVADMAGNVWEWVTSSLADGKVVLRGGSYAFSKLTAQISNREVVFPALRDQRLGLRVCADLVKHQP